MLGVVEPDTHTHSDEELLKDLDGDWEIACEIRNAVARYGTGFPECKGDPAEWIGWRPNCCDGGPRYRLICDFCRRVYLRWQAQAAHIVCGYCGVETGGFCDFTPLRKS